MMRAAGVSCPARRHGWRGAVRFGRADAIVAIQAVLPPASGLLAGSVEVFAVAFVATLLGGIAMAAFLPAGDEAPPEQPAPGRGRPR